MSEIPPDMSIEDLSQRVGVATRTIRYYIAEGLLPGPGSRGKSAAYGEEHLMRLRLIRRLVERRVPLAEQRALLDRLSAEETRELLAEEEAHGQAMERAALAESPRAYVAGLLARARSARAPATPSAPPGTRPKVVSPTPWLAAPSGATGAAGMGTASMRAASADVAPDLAEPPGAEGDVWRRWELAPGVELHVRVDARTALSGATRAAAA